MAGDGESFFQVLVDAARQARGEMESRDFLRHYLMPEPKLTVEARRVLFNEAIPFELRCSPDGPVIHFRTSVPTMSTNLRNQPAGIHIVQLTQDFPCPSCFGAMFPVGYRMSEQAFGVHCPRCNSLYIVRDVDDFAGQCQRHAALKYPPPTVMPVPCDLIPQPQLEPESWRDRPPLL